VFYFLGFIILAGLVHEAGHWITAVLLGTSIKFEMFSSKLGPITIPRLVWDMPDIKEWKQRFIAQSGFVVEFILIPFVYVFIPNIAIWYTLATIFHFMTYPWYSADKAYTDFQWF